MFHLSEERRRYWTLRLSGWISLQFGCEVLGNREQISPRHFQVHMRLVIGYVRTPVHRAPGAVFEDEMDPQGNAD